MATVSFFKNYEDCRAPLTAHINNLKATQRNQALYKNILAAVFFVVCPIFAKLGMWKTSTLAALGVVITLIAGKINDNRYGTRIATLNNCLVCMNKENDWTNTLKEYLGEYELTQAVQIEFIWKAFLKTQQMKQPSREITRASLTPSERKAQNSKNDLLKLLEADLVRLGAKTSSE